MTAPPFRLFLNTIILFRKKKGHALVPVLYFLFFDFPSGTPSSSVSSFGVRKKIILINSAGTKGFFSPLLPRDLAFLFSHCIKKISLYFNGGILFLKTVHEI